MKTQLATLAFLATAAAAWAKPTPTVLSTDIGGDVDDTWALAHLIRSPELDLKLVLAETGEVAFRAAVAAKYLEVTGRSDVAVALGLDEGVMGDEHRHQGPWVENYKLEDYPGPLHQDGTQALIDFVRASEETVAVIAIGPAPAVAEALRRAPDIASKCVLYGMFGSFDVGYGGSPQPANEYNVRANVEAFRSLMAADWKEVRITPLDTCGLVVLDGENYHQVWCATDDPVTRAVIENYCIWAPRVPWMDATSFFTTRSSPLFDNVAVYMAYGDDFINYETITFSVDDEGRTQRDPNGPYTAEVAISWKDLEGFDRHLTERLLGRE